MDSDDDEFLYCEEEFSEPEDDEDDEYNIIGDSEGEYEVQLSKFHTKDIDDFPHECLTLKQL